MGRKLGQKHTFSSLGKVEMKTIKKFQNKPKKRYRILVQERKSDKCDSEKMRSFMIYDFKGMSTVDSIKRKLQKAVKWFKK